VLDWIERLWTGLVVCYLEKGIVGGLRRKREWCCG